MSDSAAYKSPAGLPLSQLQAAGGDAIELDESLRRRCPSCFAAELADGRCPVCHFDRETYKPSAQALPLYTVLREQYVLGRVLGLGGFGITYLGWDRNLNLKVAIKEYFPSQWVYRDAGTRSVTAVSHEVVEYFQSGLAKFLEEARTLARFQEHPGIVSVVNYFPAFQTGYLVMSYVQGITLKEYLENQGGKIPADVAVKVLLPVIDALAEVHDAGILHRDISPDNIYITDSGQVKLLDFGAARMASGDGTQNLSVIYKPGFAPPEQYMSQGRQGPWTDVYALGATLYRAISGHVPTQSVERFHSDDLQPFAQYGVTVSPVIENAIRQALAVDYQQRFQSLREFQQALFPDPLSVSIPLLPPKPRPAPSPVPEPKPALKRRAASIRPVGLAAASAAAVALLVYLLPSRAPVPEDAEGRPPAANSGTNVKENPAHAPVPAVAPPASQAGAIDANLLGTWAMSRSADGLPIDGAWKLFADGRYQLKMSYAERGQLQVQGNQWTFQSAKSGMKLGTYAFLDSGELQLSGLPFSTQPLVRLRRDGVHGTAHPAIHSFIGHWLESFEDFGVKGTRVLTVHENGEYDLNVVMLGEGSFAARDGLWKLHSNIGSFDDFGTYSFPDESSGRRNQAQFQGHTLLTMSWVRTLGDS